MAPNGDDRLGLALSRNRTPLTRADDVGRARLVSRLPSWHDGRRLTLVLAPAGWGKTTLLAQWAAAETSPPVAFLSIDEGDDQPSRFLAGLTTALGSLVPAVLDLEPHPSASPWIDYALPSVAELLASSGPRLAIVLDDYHLISEPDVHIVVQAMLETLPPTVHLVLSSRVDPPLRLGRLRAGRDVEEIRLADLRFTPHEVATFLRSAFAVDLDEPSIAALHRRTEGWAAGVSLASMSLSQSDDPAAAVGAMARADRLIFDYLSEETLGGMRPELRQFLMKMSIVDQFDVELSEAITGMAGSGGFLAELERRNLLIVTLAERRWYRFHHLFRSFLRREIATMPAGEVEELHRRAGEWFASHGEAALAVHHLIEGGGHERAIGVLLANRAELLVEQPAAVLGWLKRLPGALLDREPDLYLAAINSAFIVESSLSALEWIDRFEERGGGDSDVGRYTIQAQRLWGLLLAGRLPAAAELIDGVMAGFSRLTPDQLATASPFGDPGMGPEGVAILLALVGRYEGATETLQRIVDRQEAEQWTVVLSTIGAHGLLALLAWVSDDPDRARSHVEVARSMFDSQLMAGFTLFARAVDALLDPAAVTADQIDRLLRLSQRFDDPLSTALAGLAEAAYRSANGDAVEARMALAEVGDSLGALDGSPLVGELIERTEALLESPDPDLAAAPGTLTDREVQVLRALTGRLTQREIGRELYLSFNTVKTYRRSLYRKLGVRSRADAVTRARELHLI